MKTEMTTSDASGEGAPGDGNGTTGPETTAPIDGPLITLAKAWKACDATQRELFLAEVLRGNQRLWRQVELSAGSRLDPLKTMDRQRRAA